MVRSLFTAATGMNAQQKNIDNISNNLANVNTQGFKKSRIIFEDLMYQETRTPGSLTATGLSHPTGVQEGMGVNVVAVEKLFSQGNFNYTEESLDIAIQGDGFFQIELPDGTTGYTRQGSFKRDENGDVVTPQGYRLIPNISIPENAIELNISQQGEVTVSIQGEADQTNLGQITLARFINPAGLVAKGENIYLETNVSGAPQELEAGTDGMGTIRQYYLEMSNVSVVEEMVNMITAQRAYEMDSKAIQTSDEMLQIVSGLKR